VSGGFPLAEQRPQDEQAFDAITVGDTISIISIETLELEMMPR
jgi:hypothetical protein